MKCFLYISVVSSFFLSCATHRGISPSVAIDVGTQDTIFPWSLTLEKGKVCYITETSNYFGNIFITYNALWEIITPKGTRQLRQSGTIKSFYSKKYNLKDDLKKCAQKAGSDFTALFLSK